MNEYQENLETLDTAIEVVEVFDTEDLPSLEDLIRELENEENFGMEVFTTPELATIIEVKSVTEALETQLRQTRQQLFETEQEKQELATAVDRMRGNFEKFRWRTERERAEHYTFAVVSIVREFLPILDNFNRALQTAEGSINTQDSMSAQDASTQNLEAQNFSNFVGGVELIYQQTIKFLTDLGVQEITAVGNSFDPNVHEAVATEGRDDLPPNTITTEVLRGYRLGDKLIRAAMVKVSAKPEA